MPRIKPVRFAIVGLGMGKAHASAALHAKHVDLVAIAEPNQERFEQWLDMIREKGPKKLVKAAEKVERFDDYKQMIRSGICEAVSLALPTDMHFAATRFCLQQGVNVICEKPPTTDAPQMRKLARLVNDTGLCYAFVRQQRFNPALFHVREMALNGALGDVYHSESHWLRSRGVPFRGGWGVNKDSGGGVLLDLGIHKIDDAWFCMGNPQPAVAFASTHCRFDYLAKGMKLSMPYNADDFVTGLIRFENDATLNMSCSFAGNRVAPQHLDEDGLRERSDWQELMVLGTKAGVDVSKGRITKHHKNGVTVCDLNIPARLKNMDKGFIGLFNDVATSIRAGKQPLNSASHALQLMEMLDALKKSADTGRSIKIKPFTL